MPLFSASRLPADVRTSLDDFLAARGINLGRVLGWAKTTDGGVMVGLADHWALLGPEGWESMPWQDFLSATWDADGTIFAWRTVARPHVLRSANVADPGRLPEVIRERVEQTIVVRQEVEVVPGVVATLTGRRPLVEDAPLSWSVVPPRGVNVKRPGYAEGVERVIARARVTWE